MILSATLSKPTAAVKDALGADYERIRIKLITAIAANSDAEFRSSSAQDSLYFAEMFTAKQVFHKKMTAAELDDFLETHAGKTFHSCVERTESEEITILANKKGRITTLRKVLAQNGGTCSTGTGGFNALKISGSTGTGASCFTNRTGDNSLNRVKNYILEEGKPVPFLVHLGVMTSEGKVIAAKYDKFRQINRFLEYIDDVLPELTSSSLCGALPHSNGTPALGTASAPGSEERPLRVADFGCGKSYLTFATYYFLTEIKHLNIEITGLDLKEDVIAYCNKLAEQFGCTHLRFQVGDIAGFGQKNPPDMVITLHACDTATDYALSYAVKNNVTAILSVPCCQHEINLELETKKTSAAASSDAANCADATAKKSACSSPSPFAPLLKYGIIRERFAALVTDALRAEYLENAGYKVQMLEFIDMSHTPKNILIRAVKKQTSVKAGTAQAVTDSHTENFTGTSTALTEANALTDSLGVSQTLRALLQD
jgi:SAM-dependent methyltransferase